MTSPSAATASSTSPGIVGARWWHESLVDQDAQIARRKAITGILVAGGLIAGIGAIIALGVKASSSDPDVTESRKTSLQMQRTYGWSFGAVGEPLVFDGVTTKPFAASALHTLTTDLAPGASALRPFFQATLFQSPDAVPTGLSQLDSAEWSGFTTLLSSMKPIFTPAMAAAYARGKSLAALFASLVETGQTPASARAALVVDLNGPSAVAFAAGASSLFDAVFLFDNWPHPRGVVPAQETLSAAAYYQPLLAEARTKARARQPMFVLDRRRIPSYTDGATQFDNRYVAKLPTAAKLRELDTTHLLYVVPTRADAARELDDLNDDFVAYAAAGLDVKILPLDLFAPDPTGDSGLTSTPGAPATPIVDAEYDSLMADAGYVFYGGSHGSHHAFFVDYPWAKPARAATTRPASNPGKSYVPQPRATAYSSGSPRGNPGARPVPPSFATVPVVLAVGTGVILGARYSRSGSWNRASGGFGG